MLTNDRSPDAICQLADEFDVEVLPVSPSFVNLLYISKDYENHDLSSIQIVTLGSEPVSEGLLERTRCVFPSARIIQKYGTTEFGSPRTKTRSDDPTWIHMDSEIFKIKVVDDLLWVKAETTKLGYLNRDKQPFEDGWYCTGDRVEVDCS